MLKVNEPKIENPGDEARAVHSASCGESGKLLVEVGLRTAANSGADVEVALRLRFTGTPRGQCPRLLDDLEAPCAELVLSAPGGRAALLEALTFAHAVLSGEPTTRFRVAELEERLEKARAATADGDAEALFRVSELRGELKIARRRLAFEEQEREGGERDR